MFDRYLSLRLAFVLALGSAVACSDPAGGGGPDDLGVDSGSDLGVDAFVADVGNDTGPPVDAGCSSALACDDGNACTVDACDTTTGACTNTTVDPDDGDACTTDSCDPTTGVSNVAVSTDDGDACTVDACDPTTGISHTPVDVDDMDACTVDSCDPTTGVSHTPVDVDDVDACTVDACDPTTGVSHTPVDVDDMNVCTTDSCDPTTGIAHTPVDVDDMDLCTVDACDPTTGISHTPVDVDDADACTTDTCDAGTGAAVHTPVDVDDMDACTVDSCDPTTGVAHTPVDVDDGVSCTVDSCDSTTGNISHVTSDALCELDGFACTVPSCDLVLGCMETIDDSLCDDAVACTTPDTCVGAGGDVNGCSYTPVDTLCPELAQCSATGCVPATQRGAIVVTEFRMLGAEMIEIVNTTAADVSLVGFTIRNGLGDSATFGVGNHANALVVPAGGYAVGVPNPLDPGTIPAGAFVYGDAGTTFAFADTGDFLLVAAADGTVEDYVDFRTVVTTAEANVPGSSFPASTAFSTQFSSTVFAAGSTPALANDDGASWCGTFLRATGDTAGAANHGCALALLNEVLVDPTGSDEGSAFIELIGPPGATLGGMMIEDIEGGTVSTGTRNQPTLTLPAGTRMPLDGLYLVADVTIAGVTTVVGADITFNDADLENGGDDAVQLVAADATLLDALAYALNGLNGTLAVNGLAYVEGTAIAYPPTGSALARVVPTADTGNNSADFVADPTPSAGAGN